MSLQQQLVIQKSKQINKCKKCNTEIPFFNPRGSAKQEYCKPCYKKKRNEESKQYHRKNTYRGKPIKGLKRRCRLCLKEFIPHQRFQFFCKKNHAYTYKKSCQKLRVSINSLTKEIERNKIKIEQKQKELDLLLCWS